MKMINTTNNEDEEAVEVDVGFYLLALSLGVPDNEALEVAATPEEEEDEPTR